MSNVSCHRVNTEQSIVHSPSHLFLQNFNRLHQSTITTTTTTTTTTTKQRPQQQCIYWQNDKVLQYTVCPANRVFWLTWPASMQIYWNKRKRLHKKGVQLPQDWFGTPTWPPFHCFGTPIWPPWRHAKTLYSFNSNSLTCLEYPDTGGRGINSE